MLLSISDKFSVIKVTVIFKSLHNLYTYLYVEITELNVIFICLLWSMIAGKRLAIESDSDSNSMDDVEPDSDKDYDSDKDPAWKPHAATHSSAAATAAATVSNISVTPLEEFAYV